MNNLVVATDFSECSINALKHAVRVADKAQCDIYLVWVNNSDINDNEDGKDLADPREKLISIANSYKNFMPKGFEIIPVIRKGKPANEIAAEVINRRASMVIIGSHGNSKINDKNIGANAYKIVTASKCPVLTIPFNTNFSRALTDVVMVIDTTDDTVQKIPTTTKIGKLFSAKVHILGLITSNFEEQTNIVKANINTAEKYLRDHNVRNSSTFKESNDVVKTIIEFAKEIDANLISIMSEQSSDFGFALGEQAKKMINESSIPVLCIHLNDNAYSVSR